MNANEIREMEFNKSAMFGYKITEVDEYLDEVSNEFEAEVKKNVELQKKLEILARKVRQYRANEEQLKNSILDAQERANAIINEANEKSEQILKDANEQAERIIDEAKLKSIAMLDEANIEYEKVKEATNSQQKGSLLALEDLQKEVTEFKSNLIELYKEHLQKVIEMPETVEYTTEKTASPDENQLTLDSENNAE